MESNSETGCDNVQRGIRQHMNGAELFADGLRPWLERLSETEHRWHVQSIAMEEQSKRIDEEMTTKVQIMEESLRANLEDAMNNVQRQDHEAMERRMTQIMVERMQRIEQRLRITMEEKIQGFEEKLIGIVEKKLEGLEGRLKNLERKAELQTTLATPDLFNKLEVRVTELEASVQKAVCVMLPRVNTLLEQLEVGTQVVDHNFIESPEQNCSIVDQVKNLNFITTEQKRSIVTSEQNCSFMAPAQRSIAPKGKSKYSALKKLQPTCPRFDVNSQFFRACMKRDRFTVEKLLNSGADPNVYDNIGRTPLHFAAQNGCAEIMILLLRGGADVNGGEITCMTPLHWTTMGVHYRCMKILLEANCRLESKLKNGWTPLHCAANLNSVKSVEMLLEAGADSSAKEETGKTPKELSSSPKIKQLFTRYAKRR